MKIFNHSQFVIYCIYLLKTKILDHNLPTLRRLLESLRHLRHFLQRRFIGPSSVTNWSSSLVCLKCALENHILFLHKQYNACINSWLFLSSFICHLSNVMSSNSAIIFFFFFLQISKLYAWAYNMPVQSLATNIKISQTQQHSLYLLFKLALNVTSSLYVDLNS